MNKKRNIAFFTLLLSGLLGTIFSVFATFNVTLDSDFFTGILIPAQYNPVQINFNTNGNNSVGMMFLIDSKTITAENVILSGKTYSCTKQVRGLYYNSARGERIWPLDQDVLTTLIAIDPSYTSVAITGGLFTNCSGTGATSTGVYGQIRHTRSLTDYYITAGTTYTTTGNITETFANNLTLVESTNKTMSGLIHDSYGKIGTISSINLSGTLSGNTISYLTGGMIKVGTTWYTNTPIVTYKLRSYTPIAIGYVLTGDLAPLTGNINYGTITGNGTVSSTNGTKTLGVRYSWMALSYSTSTTLFLDTIPPTVPALTTGTTNIYSIGEITLTRSTAIDTGVGLSGYVYEIANDNSFPYYGIVRTGFAIGNTKSIIQNTNFLTGTFYVRIASKDQLGNTSARSNIHTIIVTGGYDTTVDDFTLGSKTNAKLSTVYKSKTITIEGLTENIEVPVTVQADLTRGMLFKNDAIAGTSAMVKNGDTIYVELISSDEYDDQVKSTLSIGTGDAKVSAYFKITTMAEHAMEYDELQYKKIKVYTIFKELIRKYILNPKALVTFFDTASSMIDDKIDESDNDDEIELLEYFKDLIDVWMDTNVHVAPNLKIYYIGYDISRKAYTSPHFITPKYFPDKARMLTYINVNNPAGSNTTTTTHASAGTVVTSWNHKVDFNFNSVEYTTKNGKKTYTIGRTTAGKYFSYKFIYPRYFDTLQAIKEYIDIQNP